VLLGRADETAALDQVLATVRGGASGVFVLRGPTGIGKTALLDWVAGQAGDMQLARVVGVESEMDLGYAGLHQIVVPFLGDLERLPAPQHAALSAAFGMVTGSAPDRFLVGLAALTLITEAAAKQPVLCVVDDAQWLDRVSLEVLGFVARRLQADPVGMIFAVRDGDRRAGPLDGLADLTVGPLADDAALELLTAAAKCPVVQRVGSRIVAQAAGNALTLVEFGGELTAAEASGAAPLAQPLHFGGRLDELYRSRVRALPPEAQQLLLVVAADQTGQPDRIWGAAGKLGIDPELAWLPAMDQLVSWEQVVRFRHPLMRSAVYYAAPAVERRRVHEALAAACDPVRDPDRRAWHLAEATVRPDEQVAAELERSAERARGRGGWASGAAFLERSADLTPDESRRARRLLEAAEARFVAGEPVRRRGRGASDRGLARRGGDDRPGRPEAGQGHPPRRARDGPFRRAGRHGAGTWHGCRAAAARWRQPDAHRPAARRVRRAGGRTARRRRRAAAARRRTAEWQQDAAR
jgi:hypothetical protein